MNLLRLGQLVREVRSDRGYDATELAKGAGLAESTLRSFEVAGKPISTAELARIATFLDVDIDALTSGHWKPAAQYRQLGAKSDFFWDDRIELERALTVAWYTQDLMRQLGVVPVLADAAVPRTVVGTPYLDGYARAREVRGKLGLGSTDVPDLYAVLEGSAGVPIVTVALKARRIAAITVKEASEALTKLAAVILNTTAGRVQQRRLVRVDLAHELAHVLFDRAGEDIEAWIDRAMDGPDDDDDRHEQRARAFAAEFLLPAPGLKDLLGAPKKEADLTAAAAMVLTACAHYETPPELTAYHLRNHAFIVEAVREKAQVVAAKSLPGLAPAAPRDSLLETLVPRAVSAGVITEGRARELLGRSIWD